jgi:hypothetical protein
VGWKKPKSLSTKEKGANLENGSANKKLGNITAKASQRVLTMKQHLNQTGF